MLPKIPIMWKQGTGFQDIRLYAAKETWHVETLALSRPLALNRPLAEHRPLARNRPLAEHRPLARNRPLSEQRLLAGNSDWLLMKTG